MISYETLDFLLAQKSKRVEYLDGEWVWVETVTPDSEMVVHGAPKYTRDEAYEDALRDCLGIIPIADEAVR